MNNEPIYFSMPKKQIQWEIYRVKGSPAAFVGVVHAPDERARPPQFIRFAAP
jgi:hypothetical protein